MTRMLIVSTIHRTLQGFLLPYAQHFRAKGWLVDGLAKDATRSEACSKAFDHCFEADWSRNPLRPEGLLRMPAVLRERVESGKYDLVHVHTPVAAFITRLALRQLRSQGRTKVVYTAHGFHFHDGRGALGNAAFAALERFAGRWTDRLVVINRSDEREAIRRRIVGRDRLRYMPGIGLNLETYSPLAVKPEEVRHVRQELGLADGQPLFLMVAGFDPGKRHRDLLTAFAALESTEVHLAFAGQGPLMDDLKRWCQQHGLGERVHFLGSRQDIPALVRASLATILPSEREGLPRSVMESMALGVPVIGTTARGVRDLLEECGGLKVPVGDPAALKDAMNRLLADPGLARKIGEESRTRMAPFDISRLLEMHEELYAELLAPELGS